jgi:hypothetical protein
VEYVKVVAAASTVNELAFFCDRRWQAKKLNPTTGEPRDSSRSCSENRMARVDQCGETTNERRFGDFLNHVMQSGIVFRVRVEFYSS